MDPQTPKSILDSGANNAVSFLTSLVVHVLVLLVLASWVMVAGSNSHGVTTLSFSAESAEMSFSLSPPQSGQLNSSESLAAEQAFQKAEFEFVAENVLLDAPSGQEAVAESLSASLTSLKTVSESLETRGSKRGASFFGTYATGGRFVYVVDSSRSMKGDRWNIAKRKLLESIRGLEREQEFFVICFDGQTSLLFNCEVQDMAFIKAGEVAIERVSRWLRSRTLGDFTMPAEALQLALSMSPDAIFILSDGEIQDNSVQLMRALNVNEGSRKQIPIHAIHLLSQMGIDTLSRLAQDNGGTFRHVDR
jgi:uncharacterized protein with von Willebrand factor type A (vWA) domain